MYYCAKCKTEYDEYPELRKCRVCSGKVFFKKRVPIKKTVKAY